MNSKLKNLALTIGGKIHPLMGHLFQVLPGAQIDAKHERMNLCTMCATAGMNGEQDTRIATARHTESGACLHHDLVVHNARGDGYQGAVSAHADEIYADIMTDVSRPVWLPRRLYARLTNRVRRTARDLAHANIGDLLMPIIERHITERTLEAERLEAQIAAQRAQNIADQSY